MLSLLLLLLRRDRRVDHGDLQRRVTRGDYDRIHANEVGEPLLQADESLGNKVQIVLNRVGSDTDITLKKAEETIGKPVYWQVPNDTRLMQEARNHGQPLLVQSSQAICSPTGTPLLPLVTQMRVMAM